MPSCEWNGGEPEHPLPASNCYFQDVVAGSNIVPTATTGTAGLGFNAGPGFDEATGLGSVNIANLANDWHTVNFNATATTFSLTPTTTTHGSNQNVSIQVTSGSGTPTGDVSIIASSITATGAPQVFRLNAGAVTGIINTLPAGSYRVHVHYTGDGVFAASDSAPIAVTIAKENSTVGSAANPLVPYIITPGGSVNPIATTPYAYGTSGAELYLDTEVFAASGNGNENSNGTPSGAVTFTILRNGSPMPGVTASLDTYGTTYLLAGPPIAAFFLHPNYATLPAGTYNITASYPGDTTFNASSATVNFTVTPVAPTVSFTTSTADITTGGTAVLNFVVTTPSGATPATGTVTFTDTTTSASLGSVSLVNGTATLSTTAITAAGANVIGAAYSGDGNYAAATPANATVTVNTSVSTTTTLTASTATPSVGTSVTLTGTIVPIPAVAATVSFYDSGVFLGSGTVSTTTGKGTLAVTNFIAGTHSLTANYAGNSTQQTSTGSLSLVVSKNTTSMTIGGTEASTYGQSVSFNGAIARSPTSTTAPAVGLTGLVNFYEGSTGGALLGSVVPVFGPGGTGAYVAVFTTSSLTGGTHNIVAAYQGDGNYSATTSTSVPLTISTASQAITFTGLPATAVFGAAGPYTLGGAASSGLPVSYSVSGPASISGTTLTITGTGTVLVTASQAGDGNYGPALSVTLTIVVYPAFNSLSLITTGTLSKIVGGYQMVVNVTNNGNSAVQNVQLTTATLGDASGATLPALLGNIQIGQSASVLLTFPSSAGADGAGAVEKLAGTYTGGTFGGSFRAVLP